MSSNATKSISRDYVLVPTTLDYLLKTYGDVSKRDKVDYSPSKYKLWFLFGENPSIGHASAVPVGRVVFNNNSSSIISYPNHFRIGSVWIHPEYREQNNAFLYMAELAKYVLSLQSGRIKKITGRVWNNSVLLDRYKRFNWRITKQFSSFCEITRQFLVKDGVYYDYDGWEILGKTTSLGTADDFLSPPVVRDYLCT